ncbi:MAG: SMP-30/gluconolactonase/LRE family protein [Eubacterium sp.]|nr:SMP-30/gluconolactonase/LRE family protein [Eubacterium sp.]
MNGRSFYEQKLADENAVYFETKYADGTVDVSEELQDAINTVLKKAGYGVLFVPSGTYLLSKMIMIPKAVRIIGYGDTRPKFVLKDHAPGFNQPDQNAKGGYRYLFWFVSEIVEEMDESHDANPGTFYSAMSNVDVFLGQGNDYAVAFRTHYAQHCFLNHIDIHIESGMAGIYDVGNEIEDVTFYGGQYGIISTKCSPGWPFVMVDCRFSNQKQSAIRSREVGWNVIRTHCKHTSNFIEVEDGYFEKIYIEDSVFEDMNSILNVALDQNSLTQINIRNCQLKSLENVAEYKDTGRNIPVEDYQCMVKRYVHGIMVSDIYPEKQIHDQIYRFAEEINYEILKTDIPQLPPMKSWVNVKEQGVCGDGVTDDTEKIQELAEQYDCLYFPQGDYRLTDTITLKDGNVLVGMNPISTKIFIEDNTENFAGFGTVKPLIQTSRGFHILMGLGIDAGARNPRACGILWKGNGKSYMNDVKFLGGHGYLVKMTGEFDMPYDEGRVRDIDFNRVWDYQYPSLIIEGGGVFKDVWSASPYASAGLLIRENKDPVKIYCLSLEHHARCELRMRKANHVTIYGFQSEEEKAEGEYALPIELIECKNITFATTYCFRTVFVQTPFDYCVKTWNCEKIKFFNVHNYSQMKYTINNFLLDVNSGVEIRPWQAAVIEVTGKAEAKNQRYVAKDEEPREQQEVKIPIIGKMQGTSQEAVKLYSGFRFADGGNCDGKGNFYFLDSMAKKIYKVDAETLELSLYFESPYKINSLGFDLRDNIIVVGEYAIPEGATRRGKPVLNELPPDSYGTSYGYWYNSQAQIVVFTIKEHKKIEKLHKINIGDVEPERVLIPGNRWRDGSDYAEVVQYNPQKAFLAPDGVTIIPCYYDLIRATNLSRSRPGRKLYSVDEMYKRVFRCDVRKDGLLENPVVLINEGDYRVKKFNEKIYVGDDQIKVYDDSKYLETIPVPERPTTFDFGGSRKDILFVTTAHSLYMIKM